MCRIAAELSKLQDYRTKINEENQKYIESHPEMRSLIDEFVSAAISAKPTDVVKFGSFFFANYKKSEASGPCPVVFAGPSGVGKGTIINKLLERFPALFGFSVSHTTRAPRPGEENGVHYNFVTKEEFEELIERKQFIEHAKVHTNYYGTSIQAVEKVCAASTMSGCSGSVANSLCDSQIRNQNKVCILDIDVQGVQNVKNSTLDFKSLFVAAPSIEELERRLRGRGTETADKIKIRLENALKEIAYSEIEGNFDRIVVNNDVDATFRDIVHILQGWFPELDLYME